MSWIFEIFGFKDLETNLKKIKMFEIIFKEIFNSYSLLKRRDGCFEFVSGKGIPFCSKWPKPQFSCHLAIPNETPRISIFPRSRTERKRIPHLGARQRSGEGVVRRSGCPKGCFWRVRFFSAPLRFSGPLRCFKSKL